MALLQFDLLALFLERVDDQAFIAELMPKFPLYTCFLSPDARAAAWSGRLLDAKAVS